MFAKLHDRLGTAGLIVAVIALVLAVAGGAYAASGGLTAKQKKEVKKIAKSFQGTGPAGPQGAKGDKGDAGAPGAKGDAGAPGANGTSVTNTTLPEGDSNCEAGGTKFVGTSTTFACNGEEGEKGEPGSPWVAGQAPTKALMKGTWAIQGGTATAENQPFFTAISTVVPLGTFSFGTLLVVEGGEEGCENGSASDPQPAELGGEQVAGVMCLYMAEHENVKPLIGPDFKLGESHGGIVLRLRSQEAGQVKAYGSWAMLAP